MYWVHHREACIFRVLAEMVGDDIFTFRRDTTLIADVHGSCDGWSVVLDIRFPNCGLNIGGDDRPWGRGVAIKQNPCGVWFVEWVENSLRPLSSCSVFAISTLECPLLGRASWRLCSQGLLVDRVSCWASKIGTHRLDPVFISSSPLYLCSLWFKNGDFHCAVRSALLSPSSQRRSF